MENDKRIMEILGEAKKLAQEYRVLTGKPLGVTGEVAEYERPSYPRSAEFLGESDEKPFRPTDVAEPIRVLVPDDFPYELRAALEEPLKRLVDVVYGEHDAEVA